MAMALRSSVSPALLRWKRANCSECTHKKVSSKRPGTVGVCRLVIEAAKKKGKKGAGGSTKTKSPGDVREGSAYEQETRRTILSMLDLEKRAPDGTRLLKGINLSMFLGAKIGLVGANGSGKSTLMRILAGVDKDYEGSLSIDGNCRVGYLPQEPELDAGETVYENVERGLQRTRDKLKEYEDVSMKMSDPNADEDMNDLMGRMDQLQAELDAVNGWEIERQLEQAMDALRCPDGDTKVSTLSGGERRRVAICRLLLEAPDILLLDEPTNHLDAESVEWLERFLRDFKGTVVCVTHDRYFLEQVSGWILELDRGEGVPFEGNYSEWLDHKAKRMQQEEKQQHNLRKEIDKELQFINSQKSGQQKKGKARMRRYDELVEAAGERVRESTLDSITIPVPPRLGDEVLRLNNLTKGYGDRLLFDNLSLEVPPGAVVGITGPNGSGKTTLFRLIMGDEQADEGEVIVGQTARPVYVEQSRGNLDPDSTVHEEISEGQDEIDLGGKSVKSRAYCSWFNFQGSAQQKRVRDLSGGERNRLQLAKSLRSGGNLLCLDEPSNDLDVATLRALEDALIDFAGTVLVVSHDRWFLNRLATHILAFEGDSQVTFFQGSWEEYYEDYKARTGQHTPSRIKYRKMPF